MSAFGVWHNARAKPDVSVSTLGLLPVLRYAVSVARRTTNSQARDPRTLRLSLWALPCKRIAPNSQGRGPNHPLSATPVASRLSCCPAASNLEVGTQGPQEPAGPPFPRSLCSTRSPSGQGPLFSFPVAPCMSVDCRHAEQWRCRDAGSSSLLPEGLLAAGACSLGPSLSSAPFAPHLKALAPPCFRGSW